MLSKRREQMKIFRVLLPVLLTTVTALAQSPAQQADSAPLSILNLEAGYEQPNHSSSSGAALSTIPRTVWASLRERQMFYRTNIPLALPARPDGTRSPQQAVIAEQNLAYNPNSSSISPGETTRARIAYSAFLTVKNTSGKVIKAVEWEYLLVDPGNQQQLQRNKLLTKKEIKPGATAVLTERVKLPRGRSSEPHNLVDQRALLKRIEYTDGSVWQRP
jgi:hypothetical protein